jgi:EmrB/QacA subfamily drug resistance transporter
MATNRSAFLTLIAAYLGLFVGLIDSNAVNLALPAIRADLGGGVTGTQWTADAYNVTFAALLLAAGSLGDRFGRRRLLRLGLLIFVAASLMCALAPVLPVLLAARGIQGVGAAVMLPQGLAIAAAAFPDPAERAKATAAWALAAASSAALGPIVGGVLTDTLGWRCIFWLNAPIGVVAMAMSYRYLPEARDPQSGRVDLPGQLLAAAGLGSLTLVLVEGRSMSTVTAATLAVAVIGCGVAFGWVQLRVRNPMLPPGLFRNRQMVIALTATFAMTFGTYGMLLVNSLAFQQERGASALATAVQFLPMPVAYLLLIPVVNVVAGRSGPRPVMTLGLALMGAGMALYAAAGPDASLGLLQLSFVLAGAGLAFNTAPAVGLALSAVPVSKVGLASGLVNLARLVGITVGIAVLGTVLAIMSGDATAGPEFDIGVRAAVLVGGVVELAAAVAAFYGVHRHPTAVEVGEEQEACHA